VEAAVAATAFRALRSLQMTQAHSPEVHLRVLSELPRHLVAVHLSAKALRSCLLACRRRAWEARGAALARGLRDDAVVRAERHAAKEWGCTLLSAPGWAVALEVLRDGFAAALVPGPHGDSNARRAGRALELCALLLEALHALRVAGAPAPAVEAARGAASAVVEGALRLRSWSAADLPAVARLADAAAALHGARPRGGESTPARLGELLRELLIAALRDGAGAPAPSHVAAAAASLRALLRNAPRNAPDFAAPLLSSDDVRDMRDALAAAAKELVEEEAAAAAAEHVGAVGGEGAPAAELEGGVGSGAALAARTVEAAAEAIDDLLLNDEVAELLREEGLLFGEGAAARGGGAPHPPPPPPLGWAPDPRTPPPLPPSSRRSSPALTALHKVVLLSCVTRAEGAPPPPSARVRAAVAAAVSPRSLPLLLRANEHALGLLADCLALVPRASPGALEALAKGAWGLPANAWTPRSVVYLAEAMGAGGSAAPLSLALCAQAAAIHCLAGGRGGTLDAKGMTRLLQGFDRASARAPALAVAVCDALAPAPTPPLQAGGDGGGGGGGGSVYSRSDALVLGPAPPCDGGGGSGAPPAAATATAAAATAATAPALVFPLQAPPRAAKVHGGGLAAFAPAQLSALLVSVLRAGVRHNALLEALYATVPAKKLVSRRWVCSKGTWQPVLRDLVDATWVAALCGGLRGPSRWVWDAVALLDAEFRAAAAQVGLYAVSGPGGGGDAPALSEAGFALATAQWALGAVATPIQCLSRTLGDGEVLTPLKRIHQIALAIELCGGGGASLRLPPALLELAASLTERSASLSVTALTFDALPQAPAPAWPPAAIAALHAPPQSPPPPDSAAAVDALSPSARMQWELCAAALAVARSNGWAPPLLLAPQGLGLGDGHATAVLPLPCGGRLALLLQRPNDFLRAPLPWHPAPHALGGRPAGTTKAALRPTQQQTLASAFLAAVVKHRERAKAAGAGFAVVRVPFTLCVRGGGEVGLLEPHLLRRARVIAGDKYALGVGK
jgi:hypothetical protein